MFMLQAVTRNLPSHYESGFLVGVSSMQVSRYLLHLPDDRPLYEQFPKTFQTNIKKKEAAASS